jgi:hypothetical protein
MDGLQKLVEAMLEKAGTTQLLVQGVSQNVGYVQGKERRRIHNPVPAFGGSAARIWTKYETQISYLA